MFKKPYRNDKGQKNTKEELRQRSNYLEKLQNASRKVKEASIEYSDSPPPPPKNHLKLVPSNRQRSRSTFCRRLMDKIKEKFKILTIVIFLGISCFLTYYFHVVLKTGVIFTHFFYIPIIFACVWWKRKGLPVAIFLAAFFLERV